MNGATYSFSNHLINLVSTDYRIYIFDAVVSYLQFQSSQEMKSSVKWPYASPDLTPLDLFYGGI